MEILGRCFGEEPKDLGKEIVLSIIVPRFYKTIHDIPTERISMKKNVLVIFPQPKERKVSKYQAALKEKEKVVNVMAAGIEKLTSGDSESAGKPKSLQVNDAPGLFAHADDIPYQQDNKQDLQVYLEKKCPAVFFKPSLNYTAQIQDGMQDILLNLSQSMLKFSQYFQYFWDVKVKPNFLISYVVIMDFDVQHRSSSSPKDLLRIQRDKKNLAKTKNKIMEIISIDNKAHTPSHNWSWNSFLANRENKANLVLYLCHKMLESNDLLAKDKNSMYHLKGICILSHHLLQ